MSSRVKAAGMIRRAIGIACVAAFAFITTPTKAQAPPPTSWVCFPSCGEGDGKFLQIANDPTSFQGQDLSFVIRSAPGSGALNISVFDGDRGGIWDSATAPSLSFILYADPSGDGSGTGIVSQTNGSSVGYLDNAWYELGPITNAPAALATGCTGSCPYVYRLVVTGAGGDIQGNNFKLRTDGTLGLRSQVFAFYGALPALWPGGVTQATASYNGKWSFAFGLNDAATFLTLWDGDFDYGDLLCVSPDTDDVDTPNTLAPFPFASPNASTEGVGVGNPSTCAPTGVGVGSPAEDTGVPARRRSPDAVLGKNILYQVTAPDGVKYLNANPSGNLEWERFQISTAPFDASQMDHQAASLPAGTYKVELQGLDLGNLNFWYFNYNLIGLTPKEKPVPENSFYTIEKYVWYDADSDGAYDIGASDEFGIPGVKVIRTNTDTGEIETAITDQDGAFAFRVAEGNYSLTVDPASKSGPLAGLRPTTVEQFAGLHLYSLNPYERRDFGYVRNTPPTANPDTTFCNCAGSTTYDVVANDSDTEGGTLTVTSVTQPANGTATIAAGGSSVTYTPTPGYTGGDSFTYTVTDDGGATASATVTVTTANTAPTAVNDTGSGNQDTAITVAVLANDSDPDGTVLVVAGATNGANGTTTVNPDGTITYTPAAGFSGTDSFDYTISDGCATVTARVTITVDPTTPPRPPGVCYAGSSNPSIGAVQSWVTNTDGTITLRTTLSTSFNDNTYGATQIGWPGNNHKFSHLVTSDMVQLALYDGAGAKKMEFRLDYFSASTGTPSGYESLGTWGGDGGMVSGDGTTIVSADSSLAANFRNGPAYWLTVSSPATDANYTPNPSYPKWIFEAWYEVTIKADAFGTAGFGYPRITDMHASPSKSGRESEPLKVVDCEGKVIPVPNHGGGTLAGSGGKVKGNGKK